MQIIYIELVLLLASILLSTIYYLEDELDKTKEYAKKNFISNILKWHLVLHSLCAYIYILIKVHQD